MRFLLLIPALLCFACGGEKTNIETSVPQFEVTDTSLVFQNTDSIPEPKTIKDTTDYENATYYFVIADTSPPWLRERTPLIYQDDQLLAVGDWWICADAAVSSNEKGYVPQWELPG